jgi:hypothetical protein
LKDNDTQRHDYMDDGCHATDVHGSLLIDLIVVVIFLIHPARITFLDLLCTKSGALSDKGLRKWLS